MKSVFVAFAATLLIAGSPQAAVFTWIGGGGNTRMNNGGNWSPGAPANANDTDWILTDVGADPGSTYANFTARSITFADDIDTTFNFGINRSTSFTRNVTLESNNGTATIAVDAGAAGNIAITGTTPSTGVQKRITSEQCVECQPQWHW